MATPHADTPMLMAVEIRAFLAVDVFRRISGTVFAFDVRVFLFLAEQTLDSARRAFGNDFADDPIVSHSIARPRREARFLTTKFERIPEAANTPRVPPPMIGCFWSGGG